MVFPVHAQAIAKQKVESELKAVLLTRPVGYLDMAMLEKHALMSATDSGGALNFSV